MDAAKKIYILIAVLVLVVLVLILAMVFGGKKLPWTGEEKASFSLCPEKITYQGEVYNIIEINKECWLAENLKNSAYRDGTPIAKLTDSDEWEKDRRGVYACYYNLPQNCENYGALYNWYVVNNEKSLCPEGWSVPTDEQWAEINDYALKVVFAGFRNSAGPFAFLDERGFWWSSTPSSEGFAYARVLDKDEQEARLIESSKSSGFSVRCVQDHNIE